MNKSVLFLSLAAACVSLNVTAKSNVESVSDDVIKQQRANLAKNTEGKGFGPQSPRDIDSVGGTNAIAFNNAPASNQMNLCNIHFHKNAEHAGGEFNEYAGNGDGEGYKSGYVYSGELSFTHLLK